MVERRSDPDASADTSRRRALGIIRAVTTPTRPGATEVAELELGPGLPALRVGSGARTLVYLPGLSLHPGTITGMERRTTISRLELLGPGYTIYIVGRRVRPVGTKFEEMAADAIRALEELGTPVDLMGASTGGMVAMHVAAARPDLVSRLVLLITGLRMSDEGRRSSQEIVDAVRAGRWRTAFGTIMPIAARSEASRAVFRAMGWLLGPAMVGIPKDPTLFLAELDEWIRTDAESIASSIVCLTRIIGGADDRVFPPEIIRRTAAVMPDAQAVIIPDLAHDVSAEVMTHHVAPFLARGVEGSDTPR
jgi:pimeloyl-ACP methyl ester carboxylesterase